MQWEKHPYFTLSSLTHWKVLIWFIIMKLNSRYLFLGLKHFTGAFNEINGGNKHVNIEIKCCHVEHTAHWWDSTFSLSHYRLSSFLAHHTSVTIWRLWNLMQDEKKKNSIIFTQKKMVMIQRSGNSRCSRRKSASQETAPSCGRITDRPSWRWHLRDSCHMFKLCRVLQS